MSVANLIGQSVGSYRILDKIGEGGMGAVYLAEHPVLHKRAAIKVLLPQLSANPDAIARFHAEARAAALLRHPAFVNVFDFGQLQSGSAFLAMDLLEGHSLRDCLRTVGRVSVLVALRVGRQIAAGMAVAHQNGIIHRDLKPDNVFLEINPAARSMLQVKILDFGVAKLMQPREDAPVTQSGALMGTPLYMSPEQCRGQGPIDHRSDIYAWACLMFAMLTGSPPFVRQGHAAIIGAHSFQTPPRLRDLDAKIPASVSALVDRCLAKEPTSRPDSMNAVVAMLDEIAGKLRLASLTEGPSLADVGLVPVPPGSPPNAAEERKTARLERPQPVPSPPASETTFGQSASALGQPSGTRRRRRTRSVAWAGLGLAAATFVFFRYGRERTPPTPAVVGPEHVQPVTAQPKAAQPDPPAAPTQAVDRPTKVEVLSTPSGAKVVDVKTGESLGMTPLAYTWWTRQGPRQLVFSKPGYRPRVEMVAPGKPHLVQLKPAARPATRPASDPDERRKL